MPRRLRFLVFPLILIVVLATSPISISAAGDGQATLKLYPIVPGIYYYGLRTIVNVGARLGNRRNVFSKVGDSITASELFLYPVGGGALRLGGYGYLQTVFNFYMQTPARDSNSFSNHSLAARGGWTTRDVLDPNQADHGVCQGGESPLLCEYRQSKPAVALIMLGSNDMASVPLAEFKANLARIITLSKAAGVIPVISTIPWRLDGRVDPSLTVAFDLAIIQVARANGAPLWNYWLAMYGLPDAGISTDKLHPSIPPDYNAAIFDTDHLRYGTTMRNLTALQVLNAIYRSGVLR